MMYSFTGFRSFLAHAPTIGKSPRNCRYISQKEKSWTRDNFGGAEREEMEALPDIPRATLTGMRPFIYGEPTVSSQIEDELEDGEGSRKGRR